ncbi:MAG: hypothetical protein JSS82_09280 [Bacteroidetes bacterium]|nr:hypothetical protein [Bacteroidota bacterium]
MKSFISIFLIGYLLILGCTKSGSIFSKQNDLAAAELKGNVKSIVTYQCSLDSLANEHCSVSIKKFNAHGFKVEVIDSTTNDFFSTRYFYNKEGLLTKLIFSGKPPFPPQEYTYLYSYGERRKTAIIRTFGSSYVTIDSSTSTFDENGNEIENLNFGNHYKVLNSYDEHGFLVRSRLIKPDTIETQYTNDGKGRILKKSNSDGIAQTWLFDKDGNTIQLTTFTPKGRTDYFTGYCEFDKNGNFLKSISFCPQTKSMNTTRRVIEYY